MLRYSSGPRATTAIFGLFAAGDRPSFHSIANLTRGLHERDKGPDQNHRNEHP